MKSNRPVTRVARCHPSGTSLGQRLVIAFVTAIATMLLALPPAGADDTEIFFGRSGDALETNPNILFVLDDSGSMNRDDSDAEGSRMDRMQAAMRLLLDQSSSFNVGLAAFQGEQGGSAIRYPIGWLEGDSGELCENGICPEETIVARPASAADDASQDDLSNVVTLDAATLVMVDSEAGTETVAQNTVSGSAIATAHAHEAYLKSDPATGNIFFDTPTPDWFFHDANYDKSRLAYRFENVTIPPDATVTSATITFTRTGEIDQKGTVAASISAEATADPKVYTDTGTGVTTLAERSDAQARTNASVPWNVPTAALDPAADASRLETPNLSALMTEIAGLNGWQSGNPVSVLISASDEYVASADDVRRFYGSDASTTLRPVLDYTYTVAADPTVGSVQRTSIAHLDEYTEQNTDAAWFNTTASVSRLFHAGATSKPRQLALRFDNLGIPRGATIRTARLTLHAAAGDAVEASETDWTRDPNAPLASDSSTTASTDPDPVDLGGASEEGVSMTIAVEMNDNPAPYGTTPLAAREIGAQFKAWDTIPDMPNTALESPDFSEVITQLINLPAWDAGDDLSLVLSAASNYNDAADNVRRFLTSTGGVKPSLEITWDEQSDSAAAVASTETTAIRFPRVHVPPGATIKAARLVFTAAAADDTPTVLTVSAQTSGAPEPLTNALNDIGARGKTSARVTWTVEPWNLIGQQYASNDLQRVVEEVVGLSDWCGGNPMTFFISNGSGRRVAEAFSNSTSGAPKLEITYQPSSVAGRSYCSNASVDVSTARDEDDAIEETDGTMRSDVLTIGTTVNTDGTGDARTIGLRFGDVRIPKDARIVSAALRLTTRTAIETDSRLRIEVEKTDNAAAFVSGTISARDWGGGIDWDSLAPAAAQEPVITTDITQQVSDTVSRGGWVAGNGMAFRLSAISGSHRQFMPNESGDQFSPDLIVYYESERTDPGTRFRENLKREVDALRPGGYTPIVSSMYEAINYFRGAPVDYGTHRGEQTDSSKYYRLSHPFSYSGGTVERPEKCSPFELDHDDCIEEIITGTPVYQSPMQSQCQSNHIVLLSDGRATRDDQIQDRVGDLINDSCADRDNDHEVCGVELAGWASATDHATSIDGNQTINLHTIALSLADNPEASAYLEAVAVAGKGGYYPANSAEQLLSAFKNIFINVSKTDASFVSPSVTVSAANRLKHREDMYFSLFKPEPTARWGGNLKRYKAAATAGQTADILDVNELVAIDPATGEFKPGARSWWSSVTDGGSVLLGGAAEQLGDGSDNKDRLVATFTGIADGGSTRLLDSDNRLTADNNRIDDLLYDLPPTAAAEDKYLETLVDWARGRDVQDVDGDLDTKETRDEMGDPMHSQPELVTYAGGESVVFVATNEGFVHAIDTDTGEERWAFIPQELLRNLYDFYENDATRNRPYGLDGGMTTWIEDDDRDGLVDPGEKAWLYLGMRRGGNSYYALDISDIDDPKFAWRIAGGRETVDLDPTTADGDFGELGQSWSRPIKTRVVDGGDGDEIDVLIFAGGYDTNQDPATTAADDSTTPVSTRSVDGIGRTLFIVDARTGELLWQPTAARIDDYDQMLYSIPSDVRVIDIDFDGLADMLFVGDTGGQMWRLDFDNDRSEEKSLAQRVTGGRIALLAGDDAGEDRRFYYPPDVSLISVGGRQQLAISIGSGWRAHPLATGTQDRFYSMRSTYVYGPPLDSSETISYPAVEDDANGLQSTGFTNVTEVGAPTAANVARGWYIDLGKDVPDVADEPGEKVLSTSITADNQLVFTTYLPESDVAACTAAAGSGAVYSVNVLNGAPTGIFGTDGTIELRDRKRPLNQSGLAGNVSVHFPPGGEATVMVGTEKLDEIDIGSLRRRSFWQELLE